MLCALYKAKISGERLQDHWSSGFQMIPFETPEKSEVPVNVEEKNRFANVLPCKFHITLACLCNIL